MKPKRVINRRKKTVTYYLEPTVHAKFKRICRDYFHMSPSNLLEVFMKAVIDQYDGRDPIQPMMERLVSFMYPPPKKGRPKKSDSEVSEVDAG